MTTEEMIAVMQHYANGGTVQIRLWSNGELRDSTNPSWCWGENEYRIKPAERKQPQPQEMDLMLIAPNLWEQIDGLQYQRQAKIRVREVIE